MQHDGGVTALAPAEVIATWPKGSFAENLAVDAAGTIHVTLHTDRAVVRVDPATRAVSAFATYPTPVAGAVFGPDGTLYVSGGQPGTPGGVVWATGIDGSVRRLASLPDAAFLNGMTLHADGRLLVVESIGGLIYAVDPASGAVVPWLADERLKALPSDFTPGANGVKLHGGYAIVSVTGRDMIVRAPLEAGGAAGAIEVLAERLRADDFAVAADGSLIIATHPAQSLVRLAPDGTRTTLAGAAQGMVGSTAVAFGRREADCRCVYVTTTGGTMTLPDDQIEPAKLVRVDLGEVGASR